MDTKLCNLFINVDKLFTKGNVNETLFNTSNLYKKYCPNGKCNTNYDRIGALCEYLLAELPKLNNKPNGSKDNVNQYYEYVFMWLADKFRKANNEGFFTLDEYYEEFLVNHNDNFNYWYELDNKMHLKDSNIILMVEFYYLFTNICNMLLESEKSELDLNKIKVFDNNCFRKYYFINSKAFKCNPYIELLTNLKKKYDEYKSLIIKKFPKNGNANNFFSDFPPINNSNNNHPEQQFESKGCELLHVIYQRPGRKYKPKKRQKMLKPPPDDLKIKKDKVESNKDKSNKPTNSAEKHTEPQKDTKQSAKEKDQPPVKKEIQQPTIKENQTSTKKETQASTKEVTQTPTKEVTQASTKEVTQASESKILSIPQKAKELVQKVLKPSQNSQEASPNNTHVSLDDKGTSKDMGIVSENIVNKQEIEKIRSKRDLQLSDIPSASQQNEPLPPPPESTNEKIPVKSENIAVEFTNKTIEPTNITADLSDNLPDTESGSAKRTKRSASQDNSENQKETTKSENTGSSSTQSKDTQESSDSNKELNIKKVIDYSVDFFRTYSSLFNDTVNKIEEHIQEIVVSKINDIIEKIHKYQQIIQKLGSTIGQIQILNDHQNGSEKSPDTQNEVENTKGNENTGINNLKKSTVGTSNQQKSLGTRQGTPNGVSADQRIESGSPDIGFNNPGEVVNPSKQPEAESPATKSSNTSVTSPSQLPSQSVTPSKTQATSPKSVPQPQREPSITLSSTASGAITTTSTTTTMPTGEPSVITISSIETTLSGQNGASKKLSRARRSLNPGSSISTPANGLGATSDTSPSATPSITISSSVPGTIPIAPITTNVSTGEQAETSMSSIENILHSQDDITKRSSRRKRSAASGSSISISSSGQGVTSDASSSMEKGSITGTEVKINEKSSIWCIGSNKKCNIIGIGIIGISIFVFLAFMFKYLSFGSRKKSKKKKITKKVINLVDGRKMEKTFINSIDREKKSKIIINSGDNKKIAKIIMNSDDTNKPIKMAIDPWDEKRKTHITINSDDNIKPIKKAIDPWDEKQMTHITINSEHTKKYTKSVINSSDRKKTNIIANSVNEKISLLNIYKFMKADPIPFINLFFLLIFFVYKRKYNFL
ncbi:CIR protein [Plasmodium chabaudi chabaudi]|uniref:CIR protein n=1 Tax=Plasmodium chabaudi chabaudi TaxID=31271 RepID=A0A4V0K3U7_PLACU|nr:CIR protein [Plasmodium chabaudi chabaudi]VTZ67606.1 CIR protein [Plasmodium chabaudi chabaudi]|eukprot:XP_016653371.1 CIR protein [Plasmodium chabaudi chabaudi]